MLEQVQRKRRPVTWVSSPHAAPRVFDRAAKVQRGFALAVLAPLCRGRLRKENQARQTTARRQDCHGSCARPAVRSTWFAIPSKRIASWSNSNVDSPLGHLFLRLGSDQAVSVPGNGHAVP